MNGLKSFLRLSLPNNFKGAQTAASWQRKVSACRRETASRYWFCPWAANYTRATNKTGHKPIPPDNLPESLQTPTQVRFVHPPLFPPILPSQFLPQPRYSGSSSIYIFKDAKQSGFTYGIISWLLWLVKKAETSAGRRRSGVGNAVWPQLPTVIS